MDHEELINDKWDEHIDRVNLNFLYHTSSELELQRHQLSLSCGKQVSVN